MSKYCSACKPPAPATIDYTWASSCWLCTVTLTIHAASPISPFSKALFKTYRQTGSLTPDTLTRLFDTTPLPPCATCHMLYSYANPSWFLCPRNDILRSMLQGQPIDPSAEIVYVPYIVDATWAVGFPPRFYTNTERCMLRGWEGEPLLLVLNSVRAFSTLRPKDIVDAEPQGRGLLGMPRETAELLERLMQMVVRMAPAVEGELGRRVDTRPEWERGPEDREIEEHLKRLLGPVPTAEEFKAGLSGN